MKGMTRHLLPLAAAAILAGCASSGRSPPPRTGEVARQPALSSPRPSAPETSNLIGSNARDLTRLFGQPALDIQEGSARKLQYLGETCVLDLYLYPRRGAGDPVVTHIDARLPDGRDTDRAACAEALRRR
jgi:hypothetical protein